MRTIQGVKILEVLVHGKNAGDAPPVTSGLDTNLRCEDLVVLTDHHVAVLDGATDPTGARFGNVSGGRFAAQVAAAAVAALPPDINAAAAIAEISRALNEAILAACAGTEPPRRPTTQLVMYSVARGELWRVGDAHYAVDGVASYGDKETDRVTAAMHKAWTEGRLLSGETVEAIRANDTAFTGFSGLFSLEDVWANRPGSRFSFGTLNGNPVPEQYIEVLDVSGATELTLASDGYFAVTGTLEQAELQLAEVLQRDPLLLSTPANRVFRAGLSSFDDRAWVRLRR